MKALAPLLLLASLFSAEAETTLLPASLSAEEESPLGITATTAWDTTYLWHGTAIGEQLWSQRVEYGTPLSDKLSLTAGAWYGGLGEFSYHEVDVYGAVTFNAGVASLTVGYTYYDYLEGGLQDYRSEPFVRISSDFLPVNLSLSYFYESVASGGLLEFAATKTYSISQNLSLVASAAVAYNDGLTTPQAGLNHLGLNVALPIAFNDKFTITPYIAANFAQEATEGLYKDDTVLVAGISAVVRF
jgi:hypothetical protein